MHGVTNGDPFPAERHDHLDCVRAAVSRAQDLCRRRGARLTPLREHVLELVWCSHAPIGAYQLLERLADTRGRVAPPTIYRALDFLSREGLIHRIVSLNAYVGCPQPGRPHLVTNAGERSMTFLVLQGVGEYDYVPLV